MTPEEFIHIFRAAKASAILRTEIADAAAPAMEAAIRGGFRVIEFTLTTPGALDLIESFSKRDDIIVGAGTVLWPQDANDAINRGAKFIVSPVVDDDVIGVAVERGVAAMPGCYTPTEMLRAHHAGALLQKLFPGPESPNYLKAVLGPMPFLRVVPTNGVHLNNVKAWQKAGAWAIGFVAPLFDPNELAAGNFGKIEERARALLKACA